MPVNDAEHSTDFGLTTQDAFVLLMQTNEKNNQCNRIFSLQFSLRPHIKHGQLNTD